MALRQLRFAVAPLVLFGICFWLRLPLPFLPALFCVLVLFISPQRPTRPLVMKLTGLIVLICVPVASIGELLHDYPAAQWSAVLAMALVGFGRQAHNPDDLVARLLLIIMPITMVLLMAGRLSAWILPLWITAMFILGVLAAIAAFCLWPERSEPVEGGEVRGTVGADRPVTVVMKALVFTSALYFCLHFVLGSAVFVAATLATFLAARERGSGRQTRLETLFGNIVGIAAGVPVLMASAILPSPPALWSLALCGSLWMSGLLRSVPIPVYLQTAFMAYLVALSATIPVDGVNDPGALGERLLALLLVALYCGLAMALLYPRRPQPDSGG
ncbi:DUF2955 domain-containing protein [Motiliproteus sediminis]|uniref:DUF2955 domain-containing protein n=1 Tax=Motiliproteus sediminis TaxID=1468178 RepID=UPI001AEFD3D2|nr:DUF2955 domain-containing protein [Motiliproteus sediminis]